MDLSSHPWQKRGYGGPRGRRSRGTPAGMARVYAAEFGRVVARLYRAACPAG